MSKMTDWPSDEAPIAEWLRPISATLRNMRTPEDQLSDHGHFGGVVVAINRRRQQGPRRKKRENGI